MTDDELIARLRAGDGTAFGILVERYYSLCLRFAWRQIGQRDDAEDALQEAFVRVYRSLRSGAEPQRFRSWLMQIVVNCCRTQVARATRRRRVEQWFLWRNANDGVAAPVVMGDELEPRLEAALGALTPPLREAFLLRHVEDVGYEEMSEITGAGVSALKMRVKRATAQMLERLSETE